MTDKTLTGEEKKKNKQSYYTYSLHPNYEKTTLSNMQRKDDAHKYQKGHMSLTYGAGTILFALKILPFQHGLLL